MKPTIEYRVRPVTRYIVTRYETSMEVDEQERASGYAHSSVVGEFDNREQAILVAEALHGGPVKWVTHDEPRQMPDPIITSQPA